MVVSGLNPSWLSSSESLSSCGRGWWVRLSRRVPVYLTAPFTDLITEPEPFPF